MLHSFYTDVIAVDRRFRSIDKVSDLLLLEPVTRAAVTRMILTSPIPIVVTETFRSKERQLQLFKEGATTLKNVGVHHYGLAADFAKLIDGKVVPVKSWEGDWTFLRTLAQENGLIWGGDWGLPQLKHKFRDLDHAQRITLFKQPGLFTGMWYPDAAYRP